jgi:hypothetical protein
MESAREGSEEAVLFGRLLFKATNLNNQTLVLQTAGDDA